MSADIVTTIAMPGREPVVVCRHNLDGSITWTDGATLEILKYCLEMMWKSQANLAGWATYNVRPEVSE